MAENNRQFGHATPLSTQRPPAICRLRMQRPIVFRSNQQVGAVMATTLRHRALFALAILLCSVVACHCAPPSRAEVMVRCVCCFAHRLGATCRVPHCSFV